MKGWRDGTAGIVEFDPSAPGSKLGRAMHQGWEERVRRNPRASWPENRR